MVSKFFNHLEDKRWERAFDKDDPYQTEMIITHGLGIKEWSNFLKEANAFSAMIMNLSSDELEEDDGCTQNQRNNFHLIKDFYIITVLPFKKLFQLFFRS